MHTYNNNNGYQKLHGINQVSNKLYKVHYKTVLYTCDANT